MQIGAEYLRGWRANFNRSTNRKGMCQNTKNMEITPVTDTCSKGDFVKKRVLTPSFLIYKDKIAKSELIVNTQTKHFVSTAINILGGFTYSLCIIIIVCPEIGYIHSQMLCHFDGSTKPQ